VKIAKHLIYRAVGTAVLAFQELRTLVCHISAVFNSRPLVSISKDPADLGVLTPAHFLSCGPPSSVVEPDVTSHIQALGWMATRSLLSADLLVPMEGRILNTTAAALQMAHPKTWPGCR